MRHPAPALAVLDALPQGVVVVDAARRLAHANAGFWAILGAEAVACPPGSTFHELARLMAYRGLLGAGDPDALAAAAVGLDRQRPVRRQIRTADGARSYDAQSHPLPDGGFVVSLQDITAQLTAREEALARARLLEGTLARLRGGVLLFDADRRVELANPAYEALVGLPGGGARPGLTMRELIARLEERGEFAADPGAAVAPLTRDRARPATHVRERPSGEVLRLDSQPMPDGGCLVEVTDVTALKRAEDEARRRAALLDGVLEALPHGICVFGPDRRVAKFNAAYARMMDGTGPSVGERLDGLVARRVAEGEYDAATAARVLARFLPEAAPLGPMRRIRGNGTVLENSMARLPDGGIISVFTDVTALHRAEAAASERAALLDAVLEAMPHGVCVFGADRRVARTNEAYRRIMGRAAARPGESIEEVGARWTAQGDFPPEDVAAAMRAYAPDAPDAAADRRRRLPDGTTILARVARLPEGGHIAVITDVSALDRAEAELRRRAAMLEASFGAMRHGLSIFGPDRRLLAVNAKTAGLVGTPPENHRPGVLFDDLVAAQVARGEVTPAEAAAAVALDRSRPQRYVRVRPNGQVLEVLSDPTPDGGFVLTFTDVTALQAAQAEARQRMAMLEAMLANIRHGLIMFGPDGRVLASNETAATLNGFPPESLVPGRLLDELVDEQVLRGELTPAHADTLKTADRRASLAYDRTRPDGTILETRSEPVPGGGWVAAFLDVTTDRRIRAELQQARSLAEAGSEAKSRFLATMSHELRTPLNAVIGFSEALAAERDPARIADYAATINQAGRALLRLVDDILDVARSQTGALVPAEEAIDPAGLLDAAMATARDAAVAAGLTLVSEVPAGLPLLRADGARLRQVLDHLLSNAVKFTPAGGQVRLSAAAGPEGLAFRVADTGIGIPPAERERMFEPFTQLDASLARRFQGSGLGLHLARVLAGAMGGTVTLEPADGPGTLVVLRFPPGRLLPAPAPLPPRPSPAGAPPSSPEPTP